MTDRIPVTLLTGFLGSGKSTLLSKILRDPRFSDTAVVVNEFGEVGLDGFLVEHSREQMVEMTSGCLCCTVRGDIRQTLLLLHDRRARGEIPTFERLVVETTGLADPAPVIHTLMSDASLARGYELAGVVTAVDAVNGAATLAAHAESVKQAAVADRIVLTKTDMVGTPERTETLARLRRDLARLNPGAPVLDRAAPDFDPRHLFDTVRYDAVGKTADVRAWLNAEAYDGHGHGHDDAHDHDVNRHDGDRHGADIRAYSLVLDEPIGTMAFTVALELLIAHQGADLLRIKGIVHLKEKPDTPVVIHGVQHIFHEPVWLDAWPDDDRRTRLVFITRNIPRETIGQFFAAWQSVSEERATAFLKQVG